MTEHDEQASVIAWWQLQQAMHPWLADIILAAIPNGGYRAPKTARTMKAEGVVAGMPDLMLCHLDDGDYVDDPSGALFIEMKRKGGKATETQLEVHRKLRAQGYVVVVCEGRDEAVRAICDYLGIEEGA
jgi:hypothetical protein